MTAHLQTASLHSTQNVVLSSSSSQLTVAPPPQQRSRSPIDSIAHTNSLQQMSLNREQSHERQQQQQQQLSPQDSSLPAAYASLKLNTSSSSSNSPHQPASSSPFHGSSPPQILSGSAQTRNSARPPSISTQQQTHPSASSATRGSFQLHNASSPSHSHPQSSGLAVNYLPPPFSVFPNSGAGQSPTPGSAQPTSSPRRSPAAAAGVQSILVEVDAVNDAVTQVTLHIGLDQKRKKQIKFPFDFRLDNSYGVAAEMVKVLRLPDAAKTEVLIAVELESKLDPIRKHYFANMGGGATATGTQQQATQPQQHLSPQQQQHPQHQQHPSQQQHHQQHHPLISMSPHTGSPSTYPTPPFPSQSQHFPQFHGTSTSQGRLPSPATTFRPTIPHQLQHTPQSPHNPPFSQTVAHPSVSHQFQSQHSPSQSIHTLASRVPSGPLPHSSQQFHPPTQTQSPASVMSRHPTQQSPPAPPQPASTSYQQQQQRNPPLLHTQSLSAISSANTSQSSLQRRSTMPVHQPGVPAVNATAAAAAAGTTPGTPSDRSKDAAPRSPPSASLLTSSPPPQLQQQQSHSTQQVQAATQPHHLSPNLQARSTLKNGSSPAAGGAVADVDQLPALPPTRRSSRRFSTTLVHTDLDSSILDGIDVAQSPLRRARSDFSHQHPTISIQYTPAATTTAATHTATAGSLPAQPTHGRSDSLNKVYSNMTVAQLKERIRARGGASRLADCIEKKDLVDFLMELSPLSPLPASPNSATLPSAAVNDGLRVPSGKVTNDPPSAPNSRSNSRHNSRPSTPDPHNNTTTSFNTQYASQAPAREVRGSSDPFADLFPLASSNTTNGLSAHSPVDGAHSPGAARGVLLSPTSTHSYRDVPSPVSATSPSLSPNPFPALSVDPLSPHRHTASRPSSNPTSARSSANRYSPKAANVSPKLPSLPLTALSSMTSNKVSSNPFVHLESGQHSERHSLQRWHDYYSDHADKQSTNTSLDAMQHHMQPADDSVAAEAAGGGGAAIAADYYQQDRKGPVAHRAVAGAGSAATAGRHEHELPDFFDHRTLNGEYHKQP